MNNSKSELKALILFKLVRRRKWGASHTSVDDALKVVPRHLIGDAKDAIKELIKNGFIVSKPTSYGLQISLNINKKEEIEKIISENI